jgi:hypothetical protein
MKMLFPRIPAGWPEPPSGWPDWLWTVPYVGSNHLLAESLPPIEDGANCQRYAAAILELFDLAVPAARSSELWSDPELQHIALGAERPLDLVLFNAKPDAYSAHVAVYLGDDQLLHLSGEVGRPDLWGYADFAERPRYASIVGTLRVGSTPEP